MSYANTEHPSTTMKKVNDKNIKSYSKIATEYYDVIAHPTCANFREASILCIERFLRRFRREMDLKVVGETGAGKTVLAELAGYNFEDVERIYITDSSPEMLHYSDNIIDNAIVQKADASDLPFRNGEINLLISSLADPYNTAEFWAEASRVLTPGGLCFFTTPSHDWAEAFRRDFQKHDHVAEFLLRDGSSWEVPSHVRPFEAQRAMFDRAHLDIVDHTEVRVSDLHSSQLSPKLSVCDGDTLPLVQGYAVRANAEMAAKNMDRTAPLSGNGAIAQSA